MNSYCERLRDERDRLGLNQSSFGELSGITKKPQGLYERGEREPDGSYFQAISAAGCDVLYILTGRHEAAGSAPLPADGSYRLAVEVIQEWQIENGKFLPLEKFLRAIDLLVELSDGEPEQLKKHSAQILRLAGWAQSVPADGTRTSPDSRRRWRPTFRGKFAGPPCNPA